MSRSSTRPSQGITDINFPGPAATPDQLAELARTIEACSPSTTASCFPAAFPPAFLLPTTRPDPPAQGGRQASAARQQRRPPAAWHCRRALGDQTQHRRAGRTGGLAAARPGVGDRAARQLLAAGLGCVVVSMGGEGALFVTADACLHANRRRSRSRARSAPATPWWRASSPAVARLERWPTALAWPPPAPSAP
jgi:hypothetical protein